MTHDTYNVNDNRTTLRIWQQNINKSLIGQLDLLNMVDSQKYDIIAFQEPHVDFQNDSRATAKWRSILPTPYNTDQSRRMRSIDSYDITAIRISGPEYDLFLFNVYNDCTHSQSIRALEKVFRSLSRSATRTSFSLLLGDFNRHHPMWDEERNLHLFTNPNLNEAQLLIDLVADYNLVMTLPARLPTLQSLTTGNYTRVDNVFISADIAQIVDSCTTMPELRPAKTDHMPIITELDLAVERVCSRKRWNFRRAKRPDHH